VDPLARLLLTGEARDGDAIQVGAGKGELTFKTARRKAGSKDLSTGKA
jgi:hypothetical protein